MPSRMLVRISLIIVAGLLLQPYQAHAHIEKGYIPDAIADMQYRILLEFEPENIDVRNKLGMILYRQNKLEEATEEFNRVLKTDSANFNATDALGLIMAKKQHHKQAIELYKRAIILRPDDALAYYHLGQSLEATNNYIGAENAYLKALKKNEQAGSPDQKRTEMLTNALKKINHVNTTK